MTVGYFGSKRMIEMINDQFWWPKLANDVIAYISNCDVCQRTKADTRKTAGLQVPLPVPQEPWEQIHIDFVVDLPMC